MAQPPKTPPSSDIHGVDRDGGKSRARGKPAEPHQQEVMLKAKEKASARPDYDPDIAPETNSQ